MKTTYEVNGKTVTIKSTASRFKKTAYQIKREILNDLEKIGITSDYVDLELHKNPMIKSTPAEISWYVNGDNYHYKCDTQDIYRNNLGVIGKLIEMETYAIRNGLKSFAQVMKQFQLGYDDSSNSPNRIKSPKEILGVPEAQNDPEFIKFKYRKLCKKYHPDSGEEASESKMREVNEAYDEVIRGLK
jgi:hypothetical protein